MNWLVGFLVIVGWFWLILVVLDHLKDHTPHGDGW